MAKRYRYFRLLLELYPKQFQRKYADQMVQTLSDMLDDHPDKTDRLLIHMRASFDLAVNIVQQNLMVLGENIMNKTVIKDKRLIAIPIVIVVILAVAFHASFQTNVVPRMVKPFYISKVKTLTLNENQSIANPMTSLYGSVPKSTNNCFTILMQSIHTEVDCQSTLQAYSKLSSNVATTTATVKKLESALSANDWKYGSNGVTLSSLILGTYQGKDNSPDALYEKVVGDYHCTFDTTIAYSKPKPAAINITFSCDRTINVFGAPSNEVYRSSRGMF